MNYRASRLIGGQGANVGQSLVSESEAPRAARTLFQVAQLSGTRAAALRIVRGGNRLFDLACELHGLHE
jgi:hypothetical protein